MKHRNGLPKRDIVGRAWVAYRNWARRNHVGLDRDIAVSYVLRSKQIRIIKDKPFTILAQYKIGRGYKLTRVS
jgi:hypothetical protein